MPGPRAHFRTNKHKNPNTGGGCLCSPDAKVQDCVGPYIVASHKEQFVSRNPYIVVGSGCAVRMAEAVQGPQKPAVVEVEVQADPLEASDFSVAELSAALHDKLKATDVHEPVTE